MEKDTIFYLYVTLHASIFDSFCGILYAGDAVILFYPQNQSSTNVGVCRVMTRYIMKADKCK